MKRMIDKHTAKLLYNSIESSKDRILGIKKERIIQLELLVHVLAGNTTDALTFNEETGFPSVGNYEFGGKTELVYGIGLASSKDGCTIQVNTVVDEESETGLDESAWFVPNMIDENAENYLDPVYTAKCLSAFIK